MHLSWQPRVAVVGLGHWGPNLARNFHSLGALHALCDQSPDSLARLGYLYPGLLTTLSFEEILESTSVDAVAIATPGATHHPLAKQALEAGKHVFIEKPMALNLADAEELCRIADQECRTLMVGHLMVYHPAFEALVELIRSGELGEIRHVHAERMDLGRICFPENALWSLASHDLGMLDALVDAEPEHVSAFGHAILQPEVEDTASLMLRYPSGLSAHLQASWIEPVRRRRFTVIGSEKMAAFDETLPNDKLRLYDSGFDRVHGEWQLRRGEESIVSYPVVEPLARECAHFLECVRTGDRPRTDGASAARVTHILERAQASLERARLLSSRI